MKNKLWESPHYAVFCVLYWAVLNRKLLYFLLVRKSTNRLSLGKSSACFVTCSINNEIGNRMLQYLKWHIEVNSKEQTLNCKVFLTLWLEWISCRSIHVCCGFRLPRETRQLTVLPEGAKSTRAFNYNGISHPSGIHARFPPAGLRVSQVLPHRNRSPYPSLSGLA